MSMLYSYGVIPGNNKTNIFPSFCGIITPSIADQFTMNCQNAFSAQFESSFDKYCKGKSKCD